MNIRILVSTLFVLAISTTAVAQHSDIELSYENEVVVLRDGVTGYIDGFQIFEGNFPVAGLSERFTENPGFQADPDLGDMVLPGDGISIEILFSNTFGSFLVYYDPDVDEMVPTEATITIEDNGGTGTADLVISNAELSGPNPQFIQTADGTGEIHSHIDFFLSEEAEMDVAGAYGILFRLTSDNPDIEPSQPIWLVFNYGMLPVDFDELAIPAFAGEAFILGDVNGDGQVDLLDVMPFVDLIADGGYLPAADINGDGSVDLLDVQPFVDLLAGG